MTKQQKISFAAIIVSTFVSGCSAAEVLDPQPHNITVQEIAASNGEKTFLTGDFNHDGHIDLIVAEETQDRIVVFVNNGAGELQSTAQFPAGAQPSWMAPVDFDTDGVADLAIINHEANTITLLRGNGDASFEPADPARFPIETEPHSHVIAAADMNNDGAIDLIIDSRDHLGVYVLPGGAEGEFDAPGQSVDVGGAPYLGFAVVDINHDGLPDIITPNRNDVSVLLNRSSTELSFEQVSPIPFQSPFAVGAADMNGDNEIDLVIAGAGEEPGIVVLKGNGEGQFAHAASAQMSAGAKLVATGDVNGDGTMDAAITSWNAQVTLVIGADTPYFVPLPLEGMRNPWGVTMADFDGDKRDEIVVGDASGERVLIYSVTSADG